METTTQNPKIIFLIGAHFGPDQYKSIIEKEAILESAEIKFMSEVSFDPNPFGDGSADILASTRSQGEKIDQILMANPGIKWVHSFSTGVDTFFSETIMDSSATLTNAKGVFCESLAEIVIFAMLWFVKRGQHWLNLKREKKFEKGFGENLSTKVLGKKKDFFCLNLF